MVKIVIDYEKCDGADCGECVDVCPMEVLIIEGDKIVIQNLEECSLCEVCMDVCPKEAIDVDED
ncbi:4Fe-4S dicluster domain-containing protein [Methanobacterium alkalithermotolerans]|uniref:4Fe-4S dicluster domain-containing protein n=1 Tax=Methanobacterium alkalithermotolerans TaxID=2731220 RepID=A0A8T8KA23_9EURY|nr:4Fe-4S dicluster domain-containing protein [Methanobacterium alkalithermotolerans]QUH23943.1 4Fe-4S dicluster domain-containing protein [Methanobacterium alkalithermotolerans]RJS49067.1 MAG: ferredoxin [Methanobacterium sp.]